MSRIEETFAAIRALGRTGLIVFTTVGYPDVQTTLAIVPALLAGGADIVELGVPFSDPLADGTTVQRATHAALQQGVTLATCLDVVAQLRAGGVDAPLVLMGYLNPILAHGVDAFFHDAAKAGVDGLIAVDATLDEADELVAGAKGSGVDLIQLIAPTTGEARMASLLRRASGFVYCVSVAGVTGARGSLPESLPSLISQIKRHTHLPIAVGFGVSRRDHVASIGQLCEAAVIGSALVDVIDQAAPGQVVTKVREYVEEVTGRRPGPV